MGVLSFVSFAAHAGAFTALAAGIGVANLALEQWSAPAAKLILSRQVQRLSQAHDARAILMGTYAQGQDTLYLSARVVRTSDALVLGSASFSMPLDNNLRAMLGAGW